MSAIRNNSNRAAARRQRGPYARGVFGTVVRFFGFGLRDDSEDDSESTGSSSNGLLNDLQSHANQNGGPKIAFPSSNRLPLTPIKSGNASTQAAPNHPPSADPDTERVASFFSQRAGTNVTPNQVESMISGLQTTPEQKFRFTFTTPSRDTSPSASPPNINSNISPNTPSRKKLTRNPNGVYRWDGAGSAKHARPRNRYASPAFGATPAKPERLIIKETKCPTEPPAQDNKRRRVNTDEVATQSVPSIPFPLTASPTTPRTNGNPSNPAALPSSRLRTPAKPSVPVVPSPLRQAWSDASSTSSREDNRQSPSQQTKQTKTANFMAELIKETTPPRKPDLSNPYQTASPIGKVGPPRRSTRRPRATGRAPVPTKEQKAEEEKRKAEEEKKKKEEEKMKEYSPQAIIEATVPKGSKRSRPPAHLETKATESGPSRPNSPPQNEGSAAPEAKRLTYVIEEVGETDEEAARSSKRSKPSAFGLGLPSTVKKAPSPQPVADVTVEEIDDVDMQAPDKESGKGKQKQPSVEPPKLTIPISGSATPQSGSPGSPTLTSRSSFTGFKASSVPKEPSKLRFSFQADNPSVPPKMDPPAPPTVAVSASPQEKSTISMFGFTIKTEPLPPSANRSAETIGPKEVPQEKKPSLSADEVKSRVRSMDAKSLPVFVLTANATAVFPSTPNHARARDAAMAVPFSSLPKYDFSTVGSGPSTYNGPIPAKFSASSINFGAGSSKAPPTPSVAPVKGFDFAAAGMKVPSAPQNTWNCTLCGLSNPHSAAKCQTCDQPAPATTGGSASKPAINGTVFGNPPPAAAVKGFDFAAAGMKAPSAPKDSWSCSLCGLSNPRSAEQCETCEQPAPS